MDDKPKTQIPEPVDPDEDKSTGSEDQPTNTFPADDPRNLGITTIAEGDPYEEETTPRWRADYKAPKINRARFFRSKIIAIIAFLLVVAVCAVGVLFYYTSTLKYVSKSLHNGGYSYSFLFTKDAKAVTLNRVNYLYGYSQHGYIEAGLVAEPTSDVIPVLCQQIGIDWKLSFMMTFAGKVYPVCDTKSTQYLAVFPYNNQNHFVELVSINKKSVVKVSEAKTIFDSTQVIQ